MRAIRPSFHVAGAAEDARARTREIAEWMAKSIRKDSGSGRSVRLDFVQLLGGRARRNLGEMMGAWLRGAQVASERRHPLVRHVP